MSAELLLELAWKSTLTLGATLIILRLLRHRSAAERSWLAHAGLMVTLLLPLVVFGAPRWQVEAPVGVAQALTPASVATVTDAAIDESAIGPVPGKDEGSYRIDAADAGALDPVAPATGGPSPIMLTYSVPAALLLALTLVAIFRLFGLKRRASVIVENGWLSAMAQAQRRMGFKHGTALLVSPDIGSPVSWGVMRPVILLNEAAIAQQGQAEAIIAHELAHVARLDWAKLLLARVTGALFWFNPLVWLLTKQCHQLREEAADDAVLAHDVPDLDYAELLVGVARHESGALLLAANGVAPSRGSLAQRVTRVLDTSLRRAPARFGWTAGVAAVAALLAAPLAALSFTEAPGARIAVATRPATLVAAALADATAAPSAQVTAVATEPADAVSPALRVTGAYEVATLERPLVLAAAALAASPAVTPTAPVQFATSSSASSSSSSASSAASAAAPVRIAAVAPAPPVPPAPPAVSPPNRAVIELPTFTALSLQGGGNVVIRRGQRQVVRVLQGDPDAVSFAVSGGNLAISGCDGDCKSTVVEVTMPAAPEALAIHGGGTVVARDGFPAIAELAVAIHGGGVIDADAITATEVAAAIRGGGVINTRARRELAASVVGGGAIRYRGDPEVSMATSGGGSVTRLGN